MGIFSSLGSILIIAFGFGALIFVHELGHFLAAKWAGIRAEAFAVGMGPVALSWRKGIGFRAGSTLAAYEKRARAHLGVEDDDAPAAKAITIADLYRAGDELGLGETEYSLRWLPIGGFVKMLGQEDANPKATSDDPRSYNMCPVGKRMIVVSAGVIMNVLLALVLFAVAFLVGVRFEAPVIGDVAASLAGGTTVANDAEEFGITTVGLQPGDVVVTIDGKPARTFNDLQIASAMGRPGVPIELTVRRAGFDVPIGFTLAPTMDPTTELLSIGVYPGQSLTLFGGKDAEKVDEYLATAGLYEQGVRAGMRLEQAGGQPITTSGELARLINESNGIPLQTTWTNAEGADVSAAITPIPLLQQLVQRSSADEGPMADMGLLGLCPPTRIEALLKGSPNIDLLLPGDIVLEAGGQAYPRLSQLRAAAAEHADGVMRMRVRRDGQDIEVDCIVSPEGRLGVGIGPAPKLPITTAPVASVVDHNDPDAGPLPTAVAGLDLMPGTRIDRVAEVPVDDWASLRAALRDATRPALEAGTGTTVRLDVTLPTPGADSETMPIALSVTDVQALHDLGWTSDLASGLFAPVYTTLDAGGNPFRAISMGFVETHKMITMTYLTIDRLFRGTVGVDQLRGPIGIVDIGAKILPKGMMYFIFFLGMISVNLAVINFLPLPIVDGGLFLFLIYEKIKGRPPSLGFQHAATIVGLCLLGAIFVVTFYNDIARLVS